jgi:hypothetical protein
MAIELKSSLVIESLKWSITAQRPLMLTGAPGIGKSSVVAQAVAQMPASKSAILGPGHTVFANGWELRDVRTTLLDAVDMRGLPTIVKGKAGTADRALWAVPDWWPTDETVKAGLAAENGVVFFDELPAAAQSTQVACFQAILDRRLGEAPLAKGWAMLAAGNRLEDRAGAQRMPTPLANRFGHINMAVDFGDWDKWALGAGMYPGLVAFLRFRKDLLHIMPKAGEVSFPTPRTWAFASEVLVSKPGKDVEYALIEAFVGQGPANECYSYIDMYRKLQATSIDAMLLNPSTATLPTDPSAMWAVSTALAERANVTNWANVITVLERLPEEYNALAVKRATAPTHKNDNTKCAITKCPREHLVNPLTNTTEFATWVRNHPSILG